MLEQQLEAIKGRIKELKERNKGTRKAKVIVENCVGCGACENVCPEGAITVDEVAKIDENKCTGCGRCIDICPRGAIVF
ncbi:MAG: hypothetical protein DRI36_02760 [Caldiserica bacterium]|nr:MAG: hypothetical protein DRI36_02760 [Caldisericota bacterium]